MRARSVDELESSVDGLDMSGLALGGGGGGDPGHPGPYTSRSGFVPTEGWVASWRERLPLDTILIVLTEINDPRVRLAELIAASAIEETASRAQNRLVNRPLTIVASVFSNWVSRSC